MTDLTKVIDGTFVGLMVVGDIHSDYAATKSAVEYARLNDLFVVFLGDLMDGGKDPYKVVSLVHTVVHSGAGAFVVGNHDHKYIRHSAGRKVILKDTHLTTLSDCGDDACDFLIKLSELSEHSHSGFVHTFGRLVFAHGAVHRTVWDDPSAMSVKIRERALYGEINGERDKDNFPVRCYNWVNDIPAGFSTITGHDRRPMGGELLEDTGPMIVRNSSGGRAFFLDTGCGKTDAGYLSGSVFSISGSKLDFDRFVRF